MEETARAENPPAEEAEQAGDLEEAVLEGEIEKQERKAKHRIGLTHISYSGPLPPPEHLARYKEVQPDFPERILRLTELEAERRHEITRKAIRLNAIETIIGQVFGLIVSIAAFITTIVLAWLGHAAAASLVGGGTIAALVTVFVKGRGRQSDESD